MLFVCPKCGLPFKVGENNNLICSAGHSYDRAAAGYYNLLHSDGGIHGDNREMVAARRTFLEAGYYLPLAERVAALVAEHTPSGGTVLDAGCGEGYYTEKIERALSAAHGQSRVYAFDISKDAVRRAAKTSRGVTFAVASSYHMPVSDGTVNTVVNLFSPMAKDEVERVLKNNGRFIFVFPEEEHLFGLKAAIYDTPYKNKPQPTDIDGFRLVLDERLRYTVELCNKESITALFYMTPYAYRTPPESRKRVLSLEKLNTDADFRILVYEKI